MTSDIDTKGPAMPSFPMTTIFKLALPALVVALLTSPSQARPSTYSYTCAALKDLIFQQGAIVLNTKGTSVYKRFVADVTFCTRSQKTQRISVPSKSGKCRIFYCVERDIRRN